MHPSRLRRGPRGSDRDASREPPAHEEPAPHGAARLGAALPHCIDCGCCCFSADPAYIRVFGVDLDRMDARARSFTTDRGGQVAMRMAEGRCAALVVDPSARTFSCAVYEARPDVCRWLARASGVCLTDRRDKAGATLIAIDALLARRP